jgi:hypothetical protein
MGQSALDEALLLDRVSRGGVPTEDRTMIAAAAIYARKSTVQNVSDEEKSITRQVEPARAYAARKGWTVADEHVFSDDGVSGGEFIKRPGLVRLISRLTPPGAVRRAHHGRRVAARPRGHPDGLGAQADH